MYYIKTLLAYLSPLSLSVGLSLPLSLCWPISLLALSLSLCWSISPPSLSVGLSLLLCWPISLSLSYSVGLSLPLSLGVQVYLKFTIYLAVHGTSQVFAETKSRAPDLPELQVLVPSRLALGARAEATVVFRNPLAVEMENIVLTVQGDGLLTSEWVWLVTMETLLSVPL